MRAGSSTWAEVAEELGYKYYTVAKYSSLDGFGDLIAWFEYKRLEQRREDWLKREETLIFDGVEAMHGALIDIMGNVPAEQKYDEILRDANGDPVMSADTGEPIIVTRTKYDYPSAYVRTYAAQTFAKIVGYEEAKRLLAQRAIKPPKGDAIEQLEAEGAIDAEFVDTSIDFGDDDDWSEGE